MAGPDAPTNTQTTSSLQIEEDTRTPDELIAIIEAQAAEIAKALAQLRL